MPLSRGKGKSKGDSNVLEPVFLRIAKKCSNLTVEHLQVPSTVFALMVFELQPAYIQKQWRLLKTIRDVVDMRNDFRFEYRMHEPVQSYVTVPDRI